MSREILAALRYTSHAEDRLSQRGIHKPDVELALKRQIETLPGQPGSQWIVGHAAAGRILKVCVRTDDESFVISAVWKQ